MAPCPVCNKPDNVSYTKLHYDRSLVGACGGGDDYGITGSIRCSSCGCSVECEQDGDGVAEICQEMCLEKWNWMYFKAHHTEEEFQKYLELDDPDRDLSFYYSEHSPHYTTMLPFPAGTLVLEGFKIGGYDIRAVTDVPEYEIHEFRIRKSEISIIKEQHWNNYGNRLLVVYTPKEYEPLSFVIGLTFPDADMKKNFKGFFVDKPVECKGHASEDDTIVQVKKLIYSLEGVAANCNEMIATLKQLSKK